MSGRAKYAEGRGFEQACRVMRRTNGAPVTQLWRARQCVEGLGARLTHPGAVGEQSSPFDVVGETCSPLTVCGSCYDGDSCCLMFNGASRSVASSLSPRYCSSAPVKCFVPGRLGCLFCCRSCKLECLICPIMLRSAYSASRR